MSVMTGCNDTAGLIEIFDGVPTPSTKNSHTWQSLCSPLLSANNCVNWTSLTSITPSMELFLSRSTWSNLLYEWGAQYKANKQTHKKSTPLSYDAQRKLLSWTKKLTTLTKSWNVMAGVVATLAFSNRISRFPVPTRWRNSGSDMAVIRSDQGISPKPSGSYWTYGIRKGKKKQESGFYLVEKLAPLLKKKNSWYLKYCHPLMGKEWKERKVWQVQRKEKTTGIRRIEI